ncbi:hypothetical protein J31TS4_24040 [Paenibacillus sp. J31TS4]|uniref:glycosyltransferase family 2 protein n=1 Tax=Paenibacillus sp. J31TS4 TaxID=2807195 RepID=UPI001B2585D5|nr:glycosyltransferase family 2 protein [Paenibacillus sp. J31TS4]GIP39124.1 hypothetical protein J31TS4_24040 [Paenibacillus sp. J31TS4]
MLKRTKTRNTQKPSALLRRSNPDHPKVSVIIPVMNEKKTLAAVISEAYSIHPRTEVIVVANGSKDGSSKIAESMGARVYHYEEPLGHDVGRSIGAEHAKGEILLFLDGDIVIPKEKLKPFIWAIQRGADVALNRYNGGVKRKKVHPVVLSKHAFNVMLGHPELKGASLTAIPHAISKKAVEIIGSSLLAVPPKAQAAAFLKGLKIRTPIFVDVGKPNPLKRGRRDPVKALIIGDHLEAIHWYIQQTDNRGEMADDKRMRKLVR